MLKVVFDIDGVIAVPRSDNNYALCEVVEGAKEAMLLLYQSGVRIILHSARWEDDRKVTEKWFQEKGIPFHELKLEKPLADVYVDDRGLLFTDWKSTLEELAWERIRKRQSEILTQ